MKAIAIIYFCVALLLTIVVPNDARPHEITEVLNTMAENEEIIDRIFKPSKNGSLGSGGYGTTYKGQFLPCDNMEVAMKFSPMKEIKASNHEYAMYTYLDAIDNPSVETYGIPSIYYYGKWNNHTMMAMTLLDCEFRNRFVAGTLNELTILIAFREFVKVIKYIHSKGIIHFDTKIANVAIQNGKGSMFDFGLSVDMMKITYTERIWFARGDLKFFPKSVFKLIGLQSNWRRLGFGEYDRFRKKYTCFVNKLEEDARTNETESLTGLRRVFVEFEKNEYCSMTDVNGRSIPFYDQLYQIVVDELKSYGEEASSSDSFISSIPDPFGRNEWPRPTEIDYELFVNRYAVKEQQAESSNSILKMLKNLWRK